jgi:hypothetical protein
MMYFSRSKIFFYYDYQTTNLSEACGTSFCKAIFSAMKKGSMFPFETSVNPHYHYPEDREMKCTAKNVLDII